MEKDRRSFLAGFAALVTAPALAAKDAGLPSLPRLAAGETISGGMEGEKVTQLNAALEHLGYSIKIRYDDPKYVGKRYPNHYTVGTTDALTRFLDDRGVAKEPLFKDGSIKVDAALLGHMQKALHENRDFERQLKKGCWTVNPQILEAKFRFHVRETVFEELGKGEEPGPWKEIPQPGKGPAEIVRDNDDKVAHLGYMPEGTKGGWCTGFALYTCFRAGHARFSIRISKTSDENGRYARCLRLYAQARRSPGAKRR